MDQLESQTQASHFAGRHQLRRNWDSVSMRADHVPKSSVRLQEARGSLASHVLAMVSGISSSTHPGVMFPTLESSQG